MPDTPEARSSRLALGTVQFGQSYGVANRSGQIDANDARAVIDLAKTRGIDTLDTAVAYGTSEQTLGDIGISGWRVVSKLPAVPEGCNVLQWVYAMAQQSLRRLRIERLYGLLLHRPQQLLDANGPLIFDAMVRLKRDGLVDKIGISVYGPEEADALTDRYALDLIQSPFNVFDRRLLESDRLSRLRARGVELHIRSVFLQGLLLMPREDRPRTFDRWQVLRRWDEWLVECGLTPLQACLRFVLQFPQIARVVVGVDSLAQFGQILAAADGAAAVVPDSLTSDDADLINPSRWNLPA